MNTLSILKAKSNIANDKIMLMKLHSYESHIKNTVHLGLHFKSVSAQQVDKTDNQAQDNVLGDRHIHIDILIDKYKEVSEQIEGILKELDESEALYLSLDDSSENFLIKENIQRKNRARKSYLESIEQQASKLKSEINRFNAYKE